MKNTEPVIKEAVRGVAVKSAVEKSGLKPGTANHEEYRHIGDPGQKRKAADKNKIGKRSRKED